MAASTLLLSSGPAMAADPAHDPFGHLDSAVGIGTNGIAVRGWAGDPDALASPVSVVFTLDGLRNTELVTSLNRPDATAAKKVGPQSGFAVTLASAPGTHTVCAATRNVGPGTSVWFGCLTAVVTGASPAELAAHSPAGYLDQTAVAKTAVTVTGWAVDPDRPAQPLRITATVDSRPATLSGLVATHRADVAAARHAGPDQGFRFGTTIAANGVHTLCVSAGNLDEGVTRTLGCTSVRIGPVPPTPAQIAAHSPSGSFQSAAAVGATGLRVTGWASDPDNRAYPLVVQAYTEGDAHTAVRVSLPTPDLAANKQAGTKAGYSFTLLVPAGSHNVCVWARNIGIGANVLLGCKALSTPVVSMPSGPTPSTPAVNKKITTTAAKFLGGRYVWGGEDPKVGFDCSGLVQYSYRVSGVSTPRTAQDQFSAARMISAGRVVPGDLVFFHDEQGYVYHVGIYAGPGRMYAAVDQAEGIKYQNIWDDTATFGSYTHS